MARFQRLGCPRVALSEVVCTPEMTDEGLQSDPGVLVFQLCQTCQPPTSIFSDVREEAMITAQSSALLQPAPCHPPDCFRAGFVAPHRHHRQLFQARAAVSDAANHDRVWPVPSDAESTAQEARAAVQRAWKDGIKRQRVELLLPLIGATDLDDWWKSPALQPPCICFEAVSFP